jgi:endonuclease/exonuclease/phosphatase family metal-dependent hydrolase
LEDWGVKRTEYREVVRELAKALGMNWAYGVEFLEIDPKQLGIDTFDDGESEEERQQLLEVFKADKNKLRAMHGSAVLSRYPIRSARLVPFTVGYDWFKETKISSLEKGKRKAGVLIGEDLLREVRRGQRTTLYVDLDVPDAPGKILTIACTHLENRAKPKVRRQQLEELLKEIHDIKHRVVVAGDMNTTGTDSTPTSVEYMLYKKLRVAKFKLDWVFVKADLTQSRQADAPFLFAPHFARTLVNLNNCLPEPISDHSPMTVDLPFHETTLGQ